MKVNPLTDLRDPVNNDTQTAPKRNVDNNADANNEPGALSRSGRDFASVLQNVSRERGKPSEDETTSERKQDAKGSEQAQREREAERREDDGGGTGGGFDQRGGVRDVGARMEAMSARAILHIADLERILAAVRTQMNGSGRREVLLDLKRSVLEGLRIKLSTDEAGRVTAEFIAASEKVKAQIDARSGELAELLRSRGVNLASLKTTLGADSSGQQGSDAKAESGAPDAVNSNAAATTAPDSIVEDEADSSSSGSTYRA